jgi:hypothetical protein
MTAQPSATTHTHSISVSDPLPSVAVSVQFDGRADPGTIAVLLDFLERARLPSTWFVARDTDPELLDRLRFGGHTAVVADLDLGTPQRR